MFNIRSLINGAIRSRAMLTRTRVPNMPTALRVRRHHDEGPPQPFDNMPFSIPSRHAATVFFAFFFGIGLWAPFAIVWYAMAKRTM